jgi:cytoskeletal protein CcmA (bactofilin family)
MPIPAQFFLYCPSETVATGSSNAADFGTFVINGGPTQTKLDEYLALDGRAAESAGLNLGSYLADPTSQPLFDLSTDMEVSYANIGSTLPPGLAGMFDLHAYVALGIPIAGARTATAGTASLIRHFEPGSEVLVQLEGDTVFNARMTVAAVTATTMTLADDASTLPQDATVLVTAILMSDYERAKTVVSFRQFQRFASPAVAADEESFNPGLYLLLYKAIDPDILGMTASQLYDDYSGQPGRVGSVADLRRVFDQPEVSSLLVSELIEIASGGALKLDGILVRSIATYDEVVADAPESMSDIALLTAAAGRELVLASIRDLQQVVTSEVITATHQISLQGALTVDLTQMRVAVPMDAFTIDAVEIRADKVTTRAVATDIIASEVSTLGAATADSLNAVAVTAVDVAANHVQTSSVAAETGVFRGSLTAGNTELGDVRAGAAFFEDTRTAAFRAEGPALVDGPLATGDLTVAGRALVTGEVTASGFDTAGTMSAGAGAMIASGSAVTVRVPMSVAQLDVTGAVDAVALRTERVDAADVDATRAKFDSLTSKTIDVDDMTIGSVSGGLRVYGATTVEDFACTNFKSDRLEADDARYRQLTVLQLADLFNLAVQKDVIADRIVKAFRLVGTQLDVTGPSALTTFVASGSATINDLSIVTDVAVAGNTTIAGTLDAGPSRVRGNMTLQGDLAVQRVVVDRDLYVEYGDVKVTRGGADIYGDVAAGGRMTLGGDLIAGGGAAFGGAGVRTAGDVNALGDVFGANARFSGDFKAGSAALGDLTAASFRCDTIALDGGIRAGGDVTTLGMFKVEGPVVAKGAVTAMELQVFGDVDAGKDVRVSRDAEIGGNAGIEGNLQVSGDVGVEGAVACDSLKVAVGIEATAVAVAGPVSAEGDLTSGGRLDVTGDATVGGDLEALGDFTADGLAIKSDAVFSANLSVAADCAVQGALSCEGDFQLDGAMIVSGPVRIEDTFECGDVVANDARLKDVVAADVRTESLATPVLEAGCLTSDVRSVAVAGPVDCEGVTVRGATSLTGPITFDGVVDFGTAPIVLRSALTAPAIASDVAAIQQARVNKITFTPASEIIAIPSGSDPSGTQVRIDTLQAQLDAMSLQLAALTATLIVWTTPSSLVSGTAGLPYSVQLAAVGAADHYIVVSGGVPAGLALDLSGLLHGTPTLAGTYSFTVRTRSAANSQVDADRAFVLTIA